MFGCTKFRSSILTALISIALLTCIEARAATANVDLDGNAANGAESQCDLNILQTFPVMIENKVTNKAGGDAFTFSWPSAGPGGFTSSIPAGTTGGVGAKWVWTTNQPVYSYTGNSCANDVCFTQTAGPDPIASFCTYACLADGTTLKLTKGATAGTVVANWTGGQSTFTVYRSTTKTGIAVPTNAVGTTDTLSFTDTPPPDTTFYYVVRGTDCNTRKSCTSDANCSTPGDGPCVSRGPFGVPGRSLFSSTVTVSAASLTSSLITFFSPPKEVFRVTSIANAGGTLTTAANLGTTPMTYTTEAYPPGCCPANPNAPHQMRCGETCVDYLNDENNCGACGVVCGEGTCCSNGSCASLCPIGQEWCNNECVDTQNDNNNCQDCGTACGDGTCCDGGACASICPAGQEWCDNACVDYDNDSANCGGCGVACGDGTCCDGGTCASVCAEGQVWCNNQCVDFDNDNANCGACGVACGDGTCCNGGTCASVCDAGQVWCNNQCVDLNNDSANCGTCGSACGDGTCCNGGTCASVCAQGQVWLNNQCVDLQNDSNNCGTYGTVCGEGTCCSAGVCASVCGAGRLYCGGLCYDYQNDPSNCGACGNVCGADAICSAGVCVACAGHGGADEACGNRCTNTNTDPYNCGACGVSCNLSCPSGFKGVCSNGQSCRCVAGTPAPQPPPNFLPPVAAVCPNPHPSPGPVAGVCPNPDPTSPVDGVCPNPDPSSPIDGVCPNPDPTSPVDGVCPNPDPSSPIPGYCPNPHPSPGPSAGVCPDPTGPPPTENETVTCLAESITQTIPPGGSAATCTQGGVLFKEVPTEITVCGDGIPGVDGQCNNATTKVTTGTFNRLVPDTSRVVGSAYVTPYAVHITSDTSNDGLLEPGESADLIVEILNAGPMNITQAIGTLSAPAVDLTDDGLVNPVALTVGAASSSFGTILGTPVTTNCTAPTLHPASNATVFPITVPLDHPGDTSHPVNLEVSGTVDGAPFTMNVPITLGIADRCDYGANTRDYDGVDGLSNPMAKLVPAGDPVPFPSSSFSAGNTRPLKLRMLCGGVNLTDASVDPPEIVGLSEATRGVLDIKALNLNSDNTNNPNDPFFRFNNSLQGGQWAYSMRTALIGTGSFTLTIRIAGRKDYVTGFVLE